MKIQPHHKSYATAWLLVLASATSLGVTILGTLIVFGTSALAIMPSESGKCDQICQAKKHGAFFISFTIAAQFFNAGLKATRKLNYEADCHYSKAEYQISSSARKA